MLRAEQQERSGIRSMSHRQGGSISLSTGGQDHLQNPDYPSRFLCGVYTQSGDCPGLIRLDFLHESAAAKTVRNDVHHPGREKTEPIGATCFGIVDLGLVNQST